jgi:hypothetical protein
VKADKSVRLVVLPHPDKKMDETFFEMNGLCFEHLNKNTLYQNVSLLLIHF